MSFCKIQGCWTKAAEICERVCDKKLVSRGDCSEFRIQKDQMVKSPNSRQSVKGAKGAAKTSKMVHQKLPWKMENEQWTEVMLTQHLPKEIAVGNSGAKLQTCKD